MYSDTRWESVWRDREVKATPAPAPTPNPSLADFTQWLSEREPQEGYAYQYRHSCAVGQYARARGASSAWLQAPLSGVWGELNALSQNGKRTFGALLDRARESA